MENGTFFKLKDSIPVIFWRTLYNYYNSSNIVVKLGNEVTNPFKITDGVKQGGILSPYLFNFYVNEMILACTDLNIGCKIGNLNVTIVSYCDDIVLLSPTKSSLQKLLDKCNEYGLLWNFNPTKSVVMILSNNCESNTNFNDFYLNGKALTKVENMIY